MKLTDEQKFKINRMIRQGVQFVAGTTSPSESNIQTQDIESVERAVQYYHDKFSEMKLSGISTTNCFHMIAEPKYMGSRATLYLDRDMDKCMATSRNGYVIRADLHQVFLDNMWILDKLNADFALIDGELLPWAFMGKGLIEKEFKALPVCVEAEHTFLSNSTFADKFNALQNSVEYANFLQETVKGKELADKYRFYETYDNLKNVQFDIDLEQDVERIEKYTKQIELYGQDYPAVFKPFNVLKSTKEGVDTLYVWENQADIFAMLTENATELEKGIVFSVENVQEATQQLTAYLTKLTENGFEGIVIKPVFNHQTLLPYMKVRNKEYLRIIYGYDYDTPKKLSQFVRKKKCNKKRRLSIIEWQLGNELLACQDDDRKRDIMAQIMFEIEAEKEVDCRL